MSKILPKPKKRYFSTPVSSTDYEIFRLNGDECRNNARTEFLLGDYRRSFLDYTNAIKCYKKALGRLGTDSKDPSRKIKREYLVMKAERRKAALYDATEQTPFIIRGLLRKIKGRHVLISFILSLFFSVLELTGNVVGNGISSHWSGIGFFLLGVFLFYFFVFGNFLKKKKKKFFFFFFFF